MTSQRPGDMMDAIERVLRAETADLRELATLAGADPRSFYIGTKLDGADLRGQNLRGMLLPNLDLDHVRHDSETLIDPDQLVASVNRTSGSVFIASPLMANAPLVGFLVGFGAKVFHPNQIEEFQASISPRAPGIALAGTEELLSSRSPLDRLERLGGQLIHVVVGRHPAGLREQWRRSWPSATVVFCSNSQRSGKVLGGRSKADVRNLCSLLLGHWDDLQPRLYPSSVFLRTKGLTPKPWLDASAQVFEQIWRMGLQYNSLFLAGPFDRDHEEREGARTLLRPESILELSALRSQLCAFINADTSLRGLSESVEYAESAIAAAQASRGLVEAPLIVRDARRGVMALGRAAFGKRARPVASPDQRQFWKFDFGDISTVVITDRADAAYVAERLVFAHELWITPRDLLGSGSARDITIWTLIAAQLRRFYGSSGPGYQALLRLVLHAAIGKHLDRETALNILDRGGVLIRAASVEHRGGEAAMQVQIAPFDEEPITFTLVFGEHGPRIPNEFAFLNELVGQPTKSNDLPPYRDIEQALLEHLLESGPVEPKNVYGPLADRFGLSESQRTTTRRDNSTPLWNNRVQWARRALNDKGYMALRRGVWALTADGLKAAGDFRGMWTQS